MASLVTCTNFAECDLAEREADLDWHLGACPNCGKLLASPHRVALSHEGQEGNSDGQMVATIVRLGGGIHKLNISFLVDGESATATEEPGRFVLPLRELGQGSHRVIAKMKTSDGRLTSSNAQWVFVPPPSERHAPWTWLAVLLLLLIVASALSWPSAGGVTEWWRGAIVAIASAAIGLWLVGLGHRELTILRDRRRGSPGRSSLRLLDTGETQSIPDQVVRAAARFATLGLVLITLGAAVFGLAGFRFGAAIGQANDQNWQVVTVLFAFLLWAAGLSALLPNAKPAPPTPPAPPAVRPPNPQNGV